MYCNHCGGSLPQPARYCPQCGRAVPGGPKPARAPLERPRQGRRLAGVCLALANHFNADVTVVRILWAVLTIFGGFVLGLIAYLVAWILIPEEPKPAIEALPSGAK